MSIRSRTALLMAALGAAGTLVALGACSNRSASKPATAGDGAPALASGDGAAGDTDSSGGAGSSGASQGDPMKEIQDQLARQFNVSPGDIKVRTIDEPKVPGLIPFTATVDPKKLGRNAQASGVFDGKKILTETAAMSAVARAWGYGARRTVPAVDVARIFSRLHSASHGVTGIFDDGTLAAFKANAYPKQQAAAALPAETTVDGLPAVTYCITSGARSIPFSVVTAIFKPDFTVELRTQPIPKD